MKMEKFPQNPILAPNPKNAWEALVNTNPGAWYDEDKQQVVLIYRAAGCDDDHRIHLGRAVSDDGFNFTRVSDQPMMSTSVDSWDGGSIEDARVVKFEDYYFITYASVPIPAGRYWERSGERRLMHGLPPETPVSLRKNLTRTGLAITKDFKKIIRLGYITDPVIDDRDVILFPERINGKFITLHRPMEWVGQKYGCSSPSIWIAFCDDLLEHKNLTLLAKAEYAWEEKIGGAAPPVKTDKGWLMLYHAVGYDKKYRVGAMLLELDNPAHILARTPEPIMVPEYDYENEGIYKGICFPCGNVVINDTLFVYYGGADQYVGVATCKPGELLDYLLANPI